LKDGKRSQVNRFDAVEGEVLSTKVFGLGIGSIGSVIDNTNIHGGGIEINDGVAGGRLVVGGFGDGTKIGAGFHFDDSEIVFGIFL